MHISPELILIIIASVVVVSYLFSIASKYIKIPSVLLLLATGIAVRVIAGQQHWELPLTEQLTEMLGAVGLIMIVLEAGLDLKLGREKISLIRSSFLAALFIFILSLAGIGAALYYLLHEPLLNCIVYGIPLSIMSSSIVIPSLHHLTQQK